MMEGTLQVIGFITLLYFVIKFAPDILMFMFKAAIALALIILAFMAFEFISHLVWNQGFYIISQT